MMCELIELVQVPIIVHQTLFVRKLLARFGFNGINLGLPLHLRIFVSTTTLWFPQRFDGFREEFKFKNTNRNATNCLPGSVLHPECILECGRAFSWLFSTRKKCPNQISLENVVYNPAIKGKSASIRGSSARQYNHLLIGSRKLRALLYFPDKVR